MKATDILKAIRFEASRWIEPGAELIRVQVVSENDWLTLEVAVKGRAEIMRFAFYDGRWLPKREA